MHSVCVCSIQFSQETAIISLHSVHLFLMEVRCVLCEVLNESLYVMWINFSLRGASCKLYVISTTGGI